MSSDIAVVLVLFMQPILEETVSQQICCILGLTLSINWGVVKTHSRTVYFGSENLGLSGPHSNFSYPFVAQ